MPLNLTCLRATSHEPRAVTMKLWEPKRKKVPKDCPKTPPKLCSVVTDPQMECEAICGRALNGCERLKCHYTQDVVFKNSPSDHETTSIGCHVGIHVDFTSILHSQLHWSFKRSVKWSWTGSAFSTNESAWSVMVTGSQSCMWSGPKISHDTSLSHLSFMQYFSLFFEGLSMVPTICPIG